MKPYGIDKKESPFVKRGDGLNGIGLNHRNGRQGRKVYKYVRRAYKKKARQDFSKLIKQEEDLSNES